MAIQKPSDNEDEYFAKEDIRLRLGLKAKYVRSQAETERCLAVAEQVGSDDAEVGEALIALGFDAGNVTILPLIPLLEVAWADGSIGYKESSLILDTARKRGMLATSPAYAKLKALTEAQPDAAFFDGCNRIYGEMLRARTGPEADLEKKSTLELMTQVAEVSGGFFGLTSSVSEEERKVLSELVESLSLSR